MYNVAIIGAGVIGASVARELGKYNLKVCVIEKSFDISEGTTKANSGIVHSGVDAKPGTLKAKYNVRGNEMFDELQNELEFPFKRNGSLILCFEEEGIKNLKEIKKQGEINGVPNISILTQEEVRKMEPNISDEVVAALYAPTGGIVCPYEYTVALCENAYTNGVEFKLNEIVEDITKDENHYVIKTNKGIIEADLVVNAAGLYSDTINNMVSENKIEIVARKGEYCLFDKIAGKIASKTLFQLPTAMGKGVLVSPTVDGNLLVGPNAVDIDNKYDVNTSKEALDDILEKGKRSIKEVPMRNIITSFSGLRAHNVAGDFVVGEAEDAKNFINAAGVESPGLTSAPAIGEAIREIIVEKLNPSKKDNFIAKRKAIPRFRDLSNEERTNLIKENPQYGKIVCRCEKITEGEIVEAIKRPLGATTLDGVKKRTRATMGGCQGGFCTAPIIDLLARELNIDKTEVKKNGGSSYILIGENKENL